MSFYCPCVNRLSHDGQPLPGQQILLFQLRTCKLSHQRLGKFILRSLPVLPVWSLDLDESAQPLPWAVKPLIAVWDSCHLNYGVCMITGLPPPNSQLCLEAPKVVPGWTLKGVCLGDYKTTGCIPQLVTDYLQNKINMDPLITHQLPFDQLHKACELYHAGKTAVKSGAKEIGMQCDCTKRNKCIL
eukprot:bmy_16086T0